MRHDLFTHPKVVRIASALKADNLRTIGGLMSVWCLFDAHSVDGQLDGYSLEYLDAYLRWEGFANAMVSVGWLIVSAESLALPSFDTHNGESAKRRCQEADRKRVRRMSASNADKSGTREEKRREEIKETSSQPVALGLAVDNSDKFAMHSKWYPSTDFIAALPFTGLSSPIYTNWEKYLGEFCLHWIAKPEITRTDAEWDKAFLGCLVFTQEKSDKEMRA